MTRSQHNRLLVCVILLVPAAAGAWWWFYWPVYEQKRLLAQAEMALAANQPDQAVRPLRQLLKVNPRHLRGHLLYARAMRRLGKVEAAREALGTASSLGLAEKEGLREAALLEAGPGEQFDRVGGTLQQILKENPDDTEVLDVLARAYVRKKNWPQADRLLTRLLELQPARRDLFPQRGQARLARQWYTEAAADFREALRDAPADFEARLSLAECLLNDARMAEAEVELLRCRQLRPERPDPLVPLATCALERGDLEAARKLLQQAVDRNPAAVSNLIEQGNLYLLRRRYDLALPVFEQAVKLDPRNKAGHLKLAQLWRQKGDLERARGHERRYQELAGEQESRLRARGAP
jgi:Flp pilus assembly protein TadD